MYKVHCVLCAGALLTRCGCASFYVLVAQFDFLLNGEAEASVSAFLCEERELDEYKKVTTGINMYSMLVCTSLSTKCTYMYVHV